MSLKKYFSKLYPVILYILKIHLLAILIFSIIRAILLISNLQNVENVETEYIVNAFTLGLFVDNIVVSFTSVLPIIFSGVICIFANTFKKIFQYGYNAYFIILYTLFFGLAIADIPYFNYFFKHIDNTILDWMQFDGEGYSMILSESSYYKYYALFFIIILVFSFFVILFSKAWRKYELDEIKNYKAEIFKYIIVFLALATFCFWGVRRKFGMMRPITPWTTHLSPSSFANALTTNTVYNYILSFIAVDYKDKEIDFAPSIEKSIELLKQDFKNKDFSNTVSPISRIIKTEGEEVKANIVIVLMESMSSYYLTQTPHLTPFLNELKEKSYYFENFYSVATHTNQGIFSTLYGFPSFFDRVIMDDRVASGYNKSPLCEGLPVLLKEKGYTHSFFVSHDKSYNNMDMFLYKNGYGLDQIHSAENYPKSKILTGWGVCDDYLFEYATNIFNKQSKELFFGTIMTISNHPDYYVPQEFMHISKNKIERAVYFADHSIMQFMENAKKEDWYKNTIFLFVGDHGSLEGSLLYEMPLTLNHVPMMIFSPLFEDKAQTFSSMGTQADIFPTIMGLLNIEYENNSMGIDLLKEKRPYAVFSNDDKLGCIDQQYLYCYNTISRQEYLYDYKKQDSKNIAQEKPLAFDSIRNYAAATVRLSNYLLDNNMSKNNKR